MRMFLAGVLLLAPMAATLPARGEEKKPVALFNGKDFADWTYHLADPQVEMGEVWSVVDGALVCRGKPAGYLRTKEDFQNYRLTLQWRWKPGGAGGNSGVLVHTSTPGAIGVWPKSLEVQLAHQNAGDFWVIGTDLDVPDETSRNQGRRYLNLSDGDEKPIGEWNTMEITCRGDEVLVKVNGKLVNHATNVNQTKGAICLQSEGTEVHFRNIELTPLE